MGRNSARRLFKVNDCVRIIRRDKYCERVGTIHSPCGFNYWNIRLDATDALSSDIVYKTENGLHPLPED